MLAGSMSHRTLLLLLSGMLVLVAARTAVAVDHDGKILFNRDIRPFLADTCFKCHGPDSAARKADLRLDSLAGATTALEDLGDGRGALVPGHPEQSEAVRRIMTDDPEDHMPPLKSGLTLTAAQIELFKKWVAQGAVYQPHWSLIRPVAATQPDVKQTDWPRNPIDRFILARLEREH